MIDREAIGDSDGVRLEEILRLVSDVIEGV